MDPAEKKRKQMIGAALVITLIAVVMVEDDDSMDIDPVQPLDSNKPARSSTGRENDAQTTARDHLDVRQLGQRTFDSQAGELFTKTSWAPKRPKMSPQQQATLAKQRAKAREKAKRSEPKPPPLQFNYIGKAIQGNKTWVFLAQGDENHIVRIGEKVNTQYRLDTINDEFVVLTYLPLSTKQTLPINDNP